MFLSIFETFNAQITVYFKPEHFKTSVPVAVTSMLVMYTLNQSVSSKLPPTSYVKFIDVWLMFGLFQPFVMIIILILMEHLPTNSVKPFNDGKRGNSKILLCKWVKLFGYIFNPIWQILFAFVYCLIAISLFMSE